MLKAISIYSARFSLTRLLWVMPYRATIVLFYRSTVHATLRGVFLPTAFNLSVAVLVYVCYPCFVHGTSCLVLEFVY